MRRTATIFLLTALLITTAGCGGGEPDDGAAAKGAATAPSRSPGAATDEPPAGKAPTGSFATGVRTLPLNRDGDRPLPVTIWYPAARAGGAPAQGRFPVVLFSHGLTGIPADYQRLLARWAAAGFVVAAPAYPHTRRGAARFDVADVLNQPTDASFVLTAVLALDTAGGDPLRGRIDTSRVAAAGHSAGGVTTVGLFTYRDMRLDAGVVLAGSALGVGTRYAGPAVPMLFIHGGRDEVVEYASGKAAYDAVPWPKAMLTLPEGDHGRALQRPGDPTFQLVSDATVEFLRWSLYGDPAARRRLPAAAEAGGLGTLDDNLG